MFRTPVGDAQSVVLVGTVPRNSVLTLQANKAGGSTTYMPPIQGAAGVRFLYKPQASAFRLTPLPANRQRIANLFPPADRLVLVAPDRQRVASIGGGATCCSRHLGARSLPFPRCLCRRFGAGDYAGNLTNGRENTLCTARSQASGAALV